VSAPRLEFQFIDGSSKKFWAIELQGPSFTVHFGRIGSAGQKRRRGSATKALPSASMKSSSLIKPKTATSKCTPVQPRRSACPSCLSWQGMRPKARTSAIESCAIPRSTSPVGRPHCRRLCAVGDWYVEMAIPRDSEVALTKRVSVTVFQRRSTDRAFLDRSAGSRFRHHRRSDRDPSRWRVARYRARAANSARRRSRSTASR
jgi:predicted DNA-binding WGR domain protein